MIDPQFVLKIADHILRNADRHEVYTKAVYRWERNVKGIDLALHKRLDGARYKMHLDQYHLLAANLSIRFVFDRSRWQSAGDESGRLNGRVGEIRLDADTIASDEGMKTLMLLKLALG